MLLKHAVYQLRVLVRFLSAILHALSVKSVKTICTTSFTTFFSGSRYWCQCHRNHHTGHMHSLGQLEPHKSLDYHSVSYNSIMLISFPAMHFPFSFFYSIHWELGATRHPITSYVNIVFPSMQMSTSHSSTSRDWIINMATTRQSGLRWCDRKGCIL